MSELIVAIRSLLSALLLFTPISGQATTAATRAVLDSSPSILNAAHREHYVVNRLGRCGAA
jgi:hypothetical protein